MELFELYRQSNHYLIRSSDHWNLHTTTLTSIQPSINGWMDAKAGLRIGNNNEIHCRKIEVEKMHRLLKSKSSLNSSQQISEVDHFNWDSKDSPLNLYFKGRSNSRHLISKQFYIIAHQGKDGMQRT